MNQTSKTLEPGYSFGGPLERILPKPLLQAQNRLPSYPPGSDAYWMMEALKEALLGVGITNPNPAVGCVLVDAKNQEIARGATQAYGSLHAERAAFQRVQDPSRLEGATAYITLEPCSHQGKQPPCCDLICSSKIQRVVIARGDTNPLINGIGIQRLRDSGKKVELGLFSAEATAWNFPFFAQFELGRPVFALKWAQTIDGQLADDSSRSQWISGPPARAYTHWLRQRYDAILIGAKTLLSDFPRLTARDCVPPHQSQPLPIIFDPQGICLELDIGIQEKLNQNTFTQNRPVAYFTTKEAMKKSPQTWLQEKESVLIFAFQTKNWMDELISILTGNEITKALGHPLQSVMVEGGAKTLTTFLRSGYADLCHTVISPVMTGGQANRISMARLLQDAQRLELIANFRLGNDIVMEMVASKLKCLWN